MARFEKGNPGKPKGAKNKKTQSLREKIDLLIANNWERIQADLDSLEPKDRLNFLSGLLGYAVPKLASTTSEVSLKNQLEGLSNEKLSQLVEQILEENE